MKQFETFELTLKGEVLKENYAQINLVCKVSGAEEKTIKGFYAGNGEYKVRFLPSKLGDYHFSVSGVVNGEFDEVCEVSKSHGVVKAVRTHFEHEDGTLFFPFGTTVYGMMHQGAEIENETINTLSNKYFNKIRLCVFPKHYDFNKNEPVFYPFEKNEDGSWDTSRPNFDFFNHFENRLKQLFELGIQVDLILFHPYDRWGFSSLGREKNLQYLDYLLRRFSALPNIWWSLANEYDLILGKIPLEQWYEIEEFVANNDPYGHLLSNHQCFQAWDWSREKTTHICSQTKALAKILPLIQKLNKPAIVDECCYEGNIVHFWGSISAKEMVNRFYRMIAQGAYCTHGETFYDDNDVLWWAKGGKLHGESAPRIKFLKNIVESFKSPLVGQYGHIERIVNMTPEQLSELSKNVPEEHRGFFTLISNIPKEVITAHCESEKEWKALSEDESIYFEFLDLRTCSIANITLNATKKYNVEIIDSWNMTREVVLENVSGNVQVKLPGKEGFAILATEIN